MLKQIKRFIEAEDGATAVEYGIMVAGIAAVIVGLVYAIGTKIQHAFEKVNSNM